MLLFILFSEKLKEDVAAVKQIATVEEKVKSLRQRSRRYGFGRFEDGGLQRLGVERNYIDGMDGGDHVSANDLVQFRWGTTM